MDNKQNKRMRPTGQSIDGIAAHSMAKTTVAKQSAVKRYRRAAIGSVLALAVLIAAFLMWHTLANPSQPIMTDRYQAVFLDDGKVFFGKLQNTHGTYLTLEDVYYTQNQSTTPGESSQSTPSNRVNIVKVGEEVYGPENSMAIRADQVSFWQNLTADSQIAKAIQSQKK